MQCVWYEALEALTSATELRIIGASLPASDLGVRVLLNPVRFMLMADQVRVEIHNPDVRAQRRWSEFLGDKITLRSRKLGEEIVAPASE